MTPIENNIFYCIIFVMATPLILLFGNILILIIKDKIDEKRFKKNKGDL